MMSKKAFLIAVIVVALCQSFAIGGMLATHDVRLTSGKQVVIRSAFIDPRSLFRGHYVIINLQPGDLTKSKVESDGAFKHRETVFVELVKSDTVYWEAKRLWHKVPKGTANPVIKGIVITDPSDVTQPYRIEFPFNRYFAARNRAKALEKIQADQKLGVVLSLDKDGTGLIKGLMVDGQLVYDETVF
jgi:uncharacterized membrane-anchored protein